MEQAATLNDEVREPVLLVGDKMVNLANLTSISRAHRLTAPNQHFVALTNPHSDTIDEVTMTAIKNEATP
jgi:hypothetical protein